VTFADVGDWLTLTPAAKFEFVVDGEFAEGLTVGGDNLVLRARDALLATAGGGAGLRLRLTKNLPIASGLGGGSSDAAATLRLLDAALGFDLGEAALIGIAERLGADGPACLRARTLIAEGRGERLRSAPLMPALDAVLVNPRVASATAAVYAAFDRLEGARALDRPRPGAHFAGPAEVAAFLASRRNDLEAPAISLSPVIGEVLDFLGRQPESLLARLSGSGATCFALCRDGASARRLAATLQELRPTWWVRVCRLGDAAGAKTAPRPVRPLRGD
jgi:4-diphosphocytidyl-2-C-methyl-D-erythritol kinase